MESSRAIAAAEHKMDELMRQRPNNKSSDIRARSLARPPGCRIAAGCLSMCLAVASRKVLVALPVKLFAYAAANGPRRPDQQDDEQRDWAGRTVKPICRFLSRARAQPAAPKSGLNSGHVSANRPPARRFVHCSPAARLTVGWHANKSHDI